MKGTLLVAAALAVSVNGAAIEARQRGGDRPSARPGGGGGKGVGECGLDAFGSHTAEASQFCSSILRTGTATATETISTVYTLTTRSTVTVTIAPPSSSPPPPPPPPTTPPRPPSSPPPPPPPPSSTPRPPSSAPPSPPSSTPSSTPVQPSSSPAPTPTAGCGLVGYTKGTAAYYFDSSGTKNTFANCSAACKADTKCKSFGYGEANCMLFDVKAEDNVQYNPMSPYTFYDVFCPTELPVKAGLARRQINISIPLPFPGGGPGGSDPTTTNEAALSSACTCLITRAPASTTVSTTRTVTGNRVTVTQTITRTVGPGEARRLRRL